MESYNIDHTITSIPTSLLRQNINDIFFETGTNTGKAVEVAINCAFRKIISIYFFIKNKIKKKKKCDTLYK